MNRLFLGLSFGTIATGLLLLFIVGNTIVVNADNSTRPLMHGTPNPNTTPHHDDGGDSIIFDKEVTFHQDIRPIIEANCAGCHTNDGIGVPFFHYDSPESVLDVSEDMVFYAQTGYMPPWQPSPRTIPLQHERRLTAEQIALIAHWVEDGTPLGDPADYVPVEPQVIPSIRQDFIGGIADTFTPNDELFDEYRCFIVDLGLDDTMFMTGYEVLPDAQAITHHAILYHISGDLRQEAETLDAETEEQGWQCYSGSELSDDNTIGSWTPGMLPVVYPEDTGFLLETGDFIVLQMHYNLAARTEPDASQIALQLDPPSDGMRELFVPNIPAPVELPCPQGIDSEACTREAAIERNEILYYDNYDQFVDGMLERCDKTPEDFASQDAANVVSTCRYDIPINLTAIEILGHMHEKGKAIRFILNPDTDREQILLDIPNWDFHWQGSYQFQEPVNLSAGDVIEITCVWDNTQSEEPRYIIWGEGTDDEMCLVFLTVYLEGR